ncbi:hypothetical protein SAMN05216257_102414 [Meinhardsimonia xiamenensis]|uniref:DUF541 domain-containing protein n=2 Tax=Meinhardsimonia xiamenensis TaxID=990712 RepID=A0A1G9B717_9RHOB|nr:SIMPL domain-containing protein [Meinhardsimonia xiamenensis]PRX35111.1 hypothetical protein LV81_01705 [Meinhardsimonia xiamenensis]SDK34820.1 hypothetical protein SAMN05216257_102414 [Meinhardsimonia xiamenensis]
MNHRQLLSALLALFWFAAPALAGDERATITVSGHGEASAAPDTVHLTLGVEEFAPTARAAMAAASQGAAAILEALAAAGVEPRDVQTSEITLEPRIARGRDAEDMEITGFEARNMLRVRLRAVESAGAVLDAVLAAGANSFRGLSFGLDAPGTLAEEARRLAVADAMRRAQVLAEAAGVRLGPVVSVTETSGGAPVAMEMMRTAAPGAPVAAGEVTVSVTVTMVFALEQG